MVSLDKGRTHVLKKYKDEEIEASIAFLNEIALNGVTLRQAELLVVLRNTLSQETEEKDNGVQ